VVQRVFKLSAELKDWLLEAMVEDVLGASDKVIVVVT
jgi:hypothetical protein